MADEVWHPESKEYNDINNPVASLSTSSEKLIENGV